MWALVTGASSGIGREIAKRLAKEEYNIVAVARNSDKLKEVSEEIQRECDVEVVIIERDLSLPDSGKFLYEKTKELGIKIDTLVNNAGFGDFGQFATSELKKQTEMIAVNITALTETTYYFLLDMIDNGGKGEIINLSSMASFMPGPLMSVYYATKAYVRSFTEAIAKELEHTDIKIMALCPGPTNTNFEKVAEAESSGLFNNLKNATPEEVADFALYNLRKGKVTALHGMLNKLIVLGTRFVSDKALRNLVYNFMKVTRKNN